MGLQFTLLIKKASESGDLIGSIHEIPGPIHKTDHLPELIEWARTIVSSHLFSLGKADEHYKLQHYYDHEFIVDSELMFAKKYLDMVAEQANKSFDSAHQFAITFFNSVILLNGGAIIAILTFLEILQKDHLK